MVLGEEDSLLLRAYQVYKDEGKEYQPGQVWMKQGPCDFIPVVEVEVVERRKSFPLDQNEGIYVRDKKSGVVRLINGMTYLLTEHEELW
jgi:major vault protein